MTKKRKIKVFVFRNWCTKKPIEPDTIWTPCSEHLVTRQLDHLAKLPLG